MAALHRLAWCTVQPRVGEQRCRKHCGTLPGPHSSPLRTSHFRVTALSTEEEAIENVDVDVAFTPETDPQAGKAIDAAGAGATWSSPGWLTELGRLWGGESSVPVVDAKPEEVKELLGGALFTAIYNWMLRAGPIYLLPTGPVSSFLVVSDPEMTKHVLQRTDNPRQNVYSKGLITEVAAFLFGQGFAISGGEEWRVRRKAVGPSMHRVYLDAMIARVFGPSASAANARLAEAAASGAAVNMEAVCSQLTLDVIGKAVFNYEFNALTEDSPIIQAVYTALKETEQRATDLLPYWKVPLLCKLVPRQQKALAAVEEIRRCTEMLIAQCREMVDAEEAAAFSATEDYINESDPSILRFLIASREEVSSSQLRDDLLSMLVAGHETTASALTWTLYLLVQNPDKMALAQAEVDRVLADKPHPDMEDYMKALPYCMRCVCESMRLYPHPPVLLRRALKADVLPGGHEVPEGQDVMLSIYNLHHSAAVWDDPEAFIPERFGPLDGPVPTEMNTGFKYVPFSGGPRKCVGDQFALMEAVVALAVMVKAHDFELQKDQVIGMTTGATIHTTNGLYMHVKPRGAAAAAAAQEGG